MRARWTPRLEKQALDLGVYGQTDYTSFIILGRSRVGSNLLRGLLNAHPQVAAYGEIFRDATSMDWDHLGFFQTGAMRALIQQDPVRFVDRKVFGRYPARVRAVGFKLFYYHARSGDQAAVWSYLQQRIDLKVIHLKRRNLLQTHLSRKRAALTDKWVDTSGLSADQEPAAVHVDFEECLKDFEQTRTWEQECDRYFDGHAKLDVLYERLASDYRSESDAIQAFLGVPNQPLTPTTFRQAQRPISDMIANFSELKDRFHGTPWAEFFKD